MLKNLYRFLSPKFQTIHLDYAVDAKPRFPHDGKPHSLLEKKVKKFHHNYLSVLSECKKHRQTFLEISYEQQDKKKIFWNNGFFPGLDVVSLYSIMALYKPKKYVEVGSGNSTKVARMSIEQNRLDTKIISIDPMPRAEIDDLADEVIRKPLESFTTWEFVETLEPNDILFIDNSHRSFPNSDVTVFFTEVLPRIPKGVLIHVHDIYIPWDYPQFMCDRFYNEQYLLATWLLASDDFEIVFPAFYVWQCLEFKNEMGMLWDGVDERVERHGGGFWLTKR